MRPCFGDASSLLLLLLLSPTDEQSPDAVKKTAANAVLPPTVDRAVHLTEAALTIVIPLAKSIAANLRRMVMSDVIVWNRVWNVMIIIGTTAIAAVGINVTKIVDTRTAEIHRGIEKIVVSALRPAIVVMDHPRGIAAVDDSLRYYHDRSP